MKRSLAALDWLRLPLALCVVFIHNYGTRVADYANLCANPFSAESIYDIVRIFCSKVFPGFAVPTFFLISGYLFFLTMPRWNWQQYREKLRRRLFTLLIPYLGWNLFHCLHLSWPTLMQIANGQAGWSRLMALWSHLGGWSMFWDGHVGQSTVNFLGVEMPFTGPVLAPLWFVRDLMVIVLFAPLIYGLLRRCGKWLLPFLAACFLCNIWMPWHGTSIACTFWFSWGAYLATEGADLVDTMRKYRVCAYTVALLTLPLLLYLRCVIPPPENVWVQMIGRLYIIASSVSVVSLAGAIDRRGWLRCPDWLAKSTFFIYCSHIFVRKQVLRPFVPIVRSGSYPQRLVVYLLVPVLTVALCVGIFQLWKYICRKWQGVRG